MTFILHLFYVLYLNSSPAFKLVLLLFIRILIYRGTAQTASAFQEHQITRLREFT